MNYFGVYHADVRPQTLGICDAPHISKGQMTLAGFESASNANTIAMIHGQLRNRRALAKELNCAPYSAPAELLLKAYAAWGDDYVLHLEGAHMSCIADVEGDRMLIARDRMGERSIFYARREESLVFADHPDMILKSAFIEPILDESGLCELFGMGPARTPGRTPLRGIMMLEPGCMLVCERCGIRQKRYFEIPVRTHEEDEKTTIAHVRELLEQSITDVIHLHPACMLSGGIDSTALTALLSTRIGRLETFSVDYRDNEKDFISNDFRPEMDGPYIRMAAKIFSTRHYDIVLEQEALAEELNRAMRARGFPGMGDIDSSLMLFAREIARHAPNVVSGECGDEVFGGYPWFRGEAQLPEDGFPWSGSMELREKVLRPEVREKLGMRAYVRDALHSSLSRYDVSGVEGDAEQVLFKLQRLCFDYFMPNLQERAARMCEIHGLNVLTPLCDNRLVEYVYNVPWKIKRLGGIEKGLLREAVRDLMPEKLRMRKKSPYPKTCSAAYASIVRGKMRVLCADSRAPIWNIVDKSCVESLASSALNPADTPWFGQLMAGPQLLAYLIQLNSWMLERNVIIDLK